ncbi:MAG TPA: conjugal transfer protein TraR [Ignavibacteria bacterium]|nr:conjugal transfer protein TraR [Ignavibacteria bacterium]
MKSKKPVNKKSAVKKAAPKKSNSVKAVKKAAGKAVKPAAIKKTAAKKPAAVKTPAKKKAAVETKKVIPAKNQKAAAGKRKLRYTSKELEHFKQILLDERRSILESAQANMKSLVDRESGEYVGDNLTYASHMAEQGTDEMEREKNYLFVQRDEKYLGYIQEALLRIEQGIYGVCTECIDEPKLLCTTCPLIPRERLEVVPITQHCIECKKMRG